jgi:hypothetical protein
MGRQYNRRQKRARGKALLKRRKKALKLKKLGQAAPAVATPAA